jgi:hypothetical protein
MGVAGADHSESPTLEFVMNITRNIIDVCRFQLQVSLGLYAHAARCFDARGITHDRVGAAVQDMPARPSRDPRLQKTRCVPVCW